MRQGRKGAEGKKKKDSEAAIVMLRHIREHCDTVHSLLLTEEETQRNALGHEERVKGKHSHHRNP